MQEPVGQEVVDAPGERIARMIVPSVVRLREPLFEPHERVRAGFVDLALERLADVLECQQVVPCEEGQDRGDQVVAGLRTASGWASEMDMGGSAARPARRVPPADPSNQPDADDGDRETDQARVAASMRKLSS